ncbi:MAG TPA: serine/threonine-protein kinase [Candidatus Acidoferrales bacterium]|nr:serine/threonine-protein kinase [Candidatus Acidoferrales bacterium]
MPGTKIFGPDEAEYEVIEYIGNGNFGEVHKVKQRNGDQVLAMKTVPSPFADATALKAFINEANLAVEIRHPNVIEYKFFHDGSKYAGLPQYILMEYADGGTLENQLVKAQRENKPFSNSDLLGMFKQLVAGMKAINDKLVHRDIKPDNILISKNVLKISDFGLSKVVTEATRKSSFKGFGHIQYMAPEAWRFEKNTVQLDIYSMGIVFYQLATLRHPFDIPTPDPHKWMEAHLYRSVPCPDTFNTALDTKLTQIIIKMVEKDSAKRFNDWKNIQGFLESGEEPTNMGDTLVEKMLQSRLKQDSATQAAEAAERQKKDEIAQFCKLVLSQAREFLVSPLQKLVAEFNRKYPGAKARESGTILEGHRFEQFDYGIIFPSGKGIVLAFVVLLEKDFVRKVRADFTRMRDYTAVRIPMYKDRRIQGWGFVKASDGRGFNILLVERPGEIYGDFVMLRNGMGVPSYAVQRPTPFPHELKELEKELHLMDAMHIYKTEASPFDANYLCEFVAQFV